MSGGDDGGDGRDGSESARIRARLLTRLNHELRAPLARIASQAAAEQAGLASTLERIAETAQRQLAWLADLQECGRCEVTPPELAPAPAYLHSLLQGVRHEPATLPALAVLDARRLAQVLTRMADHAGGTPALQVSAADGAVMLSFSVGTAAAPWRAVPMSLDQDDSTPGLMLAAHLVRAMGGWLQQSGAALRFAIRADQAGEDQAMPSVPRFALPEPFGEGHTILLLEPHQALRDYLSEILDSAGFTLAYDADEMAAPPSLVLCADGCIPPLPHSVPVLLHAAVPPARPQDVDAVLYKPAAPPQLLETVRRLLAL